MAHGATLAAGGAAMVALGVLACVIAFPTAPEPNLGGAVVTSFADRVTVPALTAEIPDTPAAAQVPAADAAALWSQDVAANAAPPATGDTTPADRDRTATTTRWQGRATAGTGYHDAGVSWDRTGDRTAQDGHHRSGSGSRTDGRNGR
jgi:hypothetical protein